MNILKFLEYITESVVEDSKFSLKFKQIVFRCLRYYYNNNWKSDSSLGNRGRGGVVGVYTLGELMKFNGINDFEEDGSDWSVINYFDTNPMVIKYIKEIYGKPVDNIKEFETWVWDNKYSLFKDKNSHFGKLLEINGNSLLNGFLNERKAHKIIKELFNIGFDISDGFLPGSTKDRIGIDFIATNKKTGKEIYFQAKPLKYFKKLSDNKWEVKSYNIGTLKSKPVDYFIFTSPEKDSHILFDKQKDKMNIIDNNTIVFNYNPKRSKK